MCYGVWRVIDLRRDQTAKLEITGLTGETGDGPITGETRLDRNCAETNHRGAAQMAQNAGGNGDGNAGMAGHCPQLSEAWGKAPEAEPILG